MIRLDFSTWLTSLGCDNYYGKLYHGFLNFNFKLPVKNACDRKDAWKLNKNPISTAPFDQTPQQPFLFFFLNRSSFFPLSLSLCQCALSVDFQCRDEKIGIASAAFDLLNLVHWLTLNTGLALAIETTVKKCGPIILQRNLCCGGVDGGNKTNNNTNNNGMNLCIIKTQQPTWWCWPLDNCTLEMTSQWMHAHRESELNHLQ